MRSLVEPPPSLRCERCHGELRFKQIEPDAPVFDREVEIFVCIECGRVHALRMIHNPYAAHLARSVLHGNVDRPGGAGSRRCA
jgi:hypothetical protein